MKRSWKLGFCCGVGGLWRPNQKDPAEPDRESGRKLGRARKRVKQLGGLCDSEREEGCVSCTARWRYLGGCCRQQEMR